MFCGDYRHVLVSLHGRNFDLNFCLSYVSDFCVGDFEISSDDFLGFAVYCGTVLYI